MQQVVEQDDMQDIKADHIIRHINHHINRHDTMMIKIDDVSMMMSMMITMLMSMMIMTVITILVVGIHVHILIPTLRLILLIIIMVVMVIMVMMIHPLIIILVLLLDLVPLRLHQNIGIVTTTDTQHSLLCWYVAMTSTSSNHSMRRSHHPTNRYRIVSYRIVILTTSKQTSRQCGVEPRRIIMIVAGILLLLFICALLDLIILDARTTRAAYCLST